MAAAPWGRLLNGEPAAAEAAYARFAAQPVDWDRTAEADAPEAYPACQTTLGGPVAVTGPGTFFSGAQRTLWFRPARRYGWRFRRQDLKETLPIRVSVSTVWTTVRNIVLCSGSPHNYMRMVEHIIALRTGLGLDHLLIDVASGDPPLFERGSADLVETAERAGLERLPEPARYVTAREPVTVLGERGSFLTLLPAAGGSRRLEVDCAIDFPNAIGRQRIRFTVTPAVFREAAAARTNTTLWMMLLYRTVGLLFADMRNTGYNLRNILVAGPRRYLNRPRLVHNGKALEAVWHRAAMDLLAAVALIDRGRLAGTLLSYKSGHALDVRLVRALYEQDLLAEL